MRLSRSLLLASIVALGMATFSASADDKARYVMKEDISQVGTLIRSNAVTASFPLNFSYEQLSEAQKQGVRSKYQSLGPDDEPPYPLKGVQPFLAAIHQANMRMQERGKISLTVRVDSNGVAQDVAIYQAPTPEMGKFAASVALQQQFKPGSCKGTPCSMEFLYEVTLNIKL